MKRKLSTSKLLTFELSAGLLLIHFLLTNSSPAPGDDRRVNDDIQSQPTQIKRSSQRYHLLKIEPGVRGVRCMTQA